MSAISRSRFMTKSLLLMVLMLLTALYHPTTGYGATMQDVEDYIAALPTLTSGYYWTQPYTTQNGQDGIKVWKRSGAHVEYEAEVHFIPGGSVLCNYSGGCGSYFYCCDG
jgi:hypothetical protein